MEESRIRWDRAVTELEALYKDVERRTFSLPAFSLSPLAIGLWNIIKFEVFSPLDVLLLLPMNAVIFIRNLFPGRWRYRTFSGKYWRYAISWLWRGEVPTFPLGVIRPLVRFMIFVHVHGRFRPIGRNIYLNDTLSEEDSQQEPQPCTMGGKSSVVSQAAPTPGPTRGNSLPSQSGGRANEVNVVETLRDFGR